MTKLHDVIYGQPLNVNLMGSHVLLNTTLDTGHASSIFLTVLFLCAALFFQCNNAVFHDGVGHVNL